MSAEQFYIFLVCAATGVVGGLIYDVLDIFRLPFRNKVVKIVVQIVFCAVFGGFYLLVSLKCELPDFRFYMFLGCCLGFWLYLKSFHKTVAFFTQKIYNGYKKKFGTKKQKKKESICRKLTFRKKKQRKLQ